jgi:pimeloyl-ACP methyl ester carboxylesterase
LDILLNNGHVVYFFHGIGGSPQDIFRPPLSYVVEAASSIYRPLFVGISFGSRGILKHTNIDEVLRNFDRIEKRILKTGGKKRHLIGLSMGGYNSLRLAAEQPRLFKSVSMLCAAVININPYSREELENYITRNSQHLNRQFLEQILGVLFHEFPNESQWHGNNPFNFLKSGRYNNLEFFVSIGREDSVGFYDSNEEWVRIANSKGIKTELHPVHGAHCAFNTFELGRFLIERVGQTD